MCFILFIKIKQIFLFSLMSLKKKNNKSNKKNKQTRIQLIHLIILKHNSLARIALIVRATVYVRMIVSVRRFR